MAKRYKVVAIGGTFDHLHVGHSDILRFAFSQAERVIIGLTSDEFISKKLHRSSLEGFETRKKNLSLFLESENVSKRAKIVLLTAIFGPEVLSPDIEGVIATSETEKNARKINIERKKRNLSSVDIILFPFTKDTKKKIIRSTRVRAGEMKRTGETYKEVFSKNLYLPLELRKTLQNPLGEIYKDFSFLKNTNSFIIAVGDIVFSTLKDSGITADIGIVDGKTRRTHFDTNYHPTLESFNPAGAITKTSVNTFRKLLKKSLMNNSKELLFIQGEEDLLALPAMLLAPLNTIVLYGQRNIGIISVTVTEEIKETVFGLLQRFKTGSRASGLLPHDDK